MHLFVPEFAQPVEKDGREHVEYVPSQIVTEYVRYRLPERIGKPIRGILYPSARKSRGIGCVLFVVHEDINSRILPDEPPFRLLADLTKTAPLTTAKK